ncbi:MAG: carboxypeptidase-like regulatory domain-containing protein [Bryobacteraceae bacterium]
MRKKTPNSRLSARVLFRTPGQHPFPRFAHPIFMGLAAVVLLLAFGGVLPAGAAPPQRRPRADDCILYSYIFTQDGRLLPGAEMSVRRMTDKKSKWKGISDRRGECAIRVSPGPEYEVEIKAQGFLTQTRKMKAETGKTEMVFHMVPGTDKKK